MALCPACARGEHSNHVRNGEQSWMGQTKPYRCVCPGDCLADGAVLARLTAVGVIAPRPVHRLD